MARFDRPAPGARPWATVAGRAEIEALGEALRAELLAGRGELALFFYGPGIAALRAASVSGYAAGDPRHCPTGTPVLVEGQRSRTLGRVSRDMLAVDLSHLPEAGLGSEVTLWGHADNGAVLPIDEVAHAAGTIGYELMCAVAPRVPVSLQAGVRLETP
jgi:hypothetical protein